MEALLIRIDMLIHEGRQLLLQIACSLRKLKAHDSSKQRGTKNFPPANPPSRTLRSHNRHPEGSPRSGESKGPCVAITGSPDQQTARFKVVLSAWLRHQLQSSDR